MVTVCFHCTLSLAAYRSRDVPVIPSYLSSLFFFCPPPGLSRSFYFSSTISGTNDLNIESYWWYLRDVLSFIFFIQTVRFEGLTSTVMRHASFAFYTMSRLDWTSSRGISWMSVALRLLHKEHFWYCGELLVCLSTGLRCSLKRSFSLTCLIPHSHQLNMFN